MNAISEKLRRLLASMGLSPQESRITSEQEGWALVFALRHPEIWNRRSRDPRWSGESRLTRGH